MRTVTKRALDILMAIVVLVIGLPVIGLVSVAILVTMGRPVFFVQERPGLHAKVFRLYKFRSMRTQGQESPPLSDEERLTGLGRFLRRTSIDELPGFANVLKGDLSLVGPRPLHVEYLERYTSEQIRRHDVRPGVTGLAQVNGRNATTWEERLRLDTWYVDHWTLWLDLRILSRTAWIVIRGSGVKNPGHATMPEFSGASTEPRSGVNP
jgi:lipopolysaccharide/colanic/teichoic acid biosynthesis glycosyltransferase